jgi:hypothetical protein
MSRMRNCGGVVLAAVLAACLVVARGDEPAAAPEPFDGRPWHVSTGNLSVLFIQASPIGAFPRPDFIEPPPTVESQVALKAKGLVANEDYIAWGAVEREPGKWQWAQHDAMEQTLHKAGLEYVVYDWVHFPPTWLREGTDRTLMRCLEHGEETNYLSIFDPRTIEWYDHFYKNLHAHFGDRIDAVYACILGPYGEGNYPLMVDAWVKMGHCHEGYWCGDRHAIAAFQSEMGKRYGGDVGAINRAWGTTYKRLDDVRPPEQLSQEGFKPTPAAFETPAARRRWLDFITWYHQAIVDFAERSIRTVLKYYPAEKVRLKPGGTAGGVNPIAWGTYSPAYAKMAGPYKEIVLQPADCHGAPFADKWLATAYRFYGVPLATEPAGDLARDLFVRRMFSDASCGASQLFTYDYPRHADDVRRYVHLYTGTPGETDVAVYCPTTLYRLGGDVGHTIRAGLPLRDVCEYDVLDELLITDGALTPARYKALVAFQADVVDRPVLEAIDAFAREGGRVIRVGDGPVRDVDGADWKPGAPPVHVAAVAEDGQWLKQLSVHLGGLRGVDATLDGVWTCRRGRQTILYNSTKSAVQVDVNGKAVDVPAGEIWNN